MMMQVTSQTKTAIRERAQDTFRSHLEHIADGNIKAWVELWGEDGVFEFPYGSAGSEGKKMSKSELYDYMKDFPKRFDVNFMELVFHPMADPELVIAEFKAVGRHRETGNGIHTTRRTLALWRREMA